MTQENKIPFNKVSETIKQDIARDLVKYHILACQSGLVGELLQKEIISYDDYQNLCMTDEEIKNCFDVSTEEEIQEIRDNGEDMNEIYEHWLVSDWLINKLKEENEPILETDLETWWGRCATGQSIILDYVIQKIAYENSYDERLYQKEVA